MTEIEFIKDLARKYANVCKFKSDFPHDFNSVKDGFIEGFKVAERLFSEPTTKADTGKANLNIGDVSGCLSNEDERIYKSKVSKMIEKYNGLHYLPEEERNAMEYIADEIFKEYNNR